MKVLEKLFKTIRKHVCRHISAYFAKLTNAFNVTLNNNKIFQNILYRIGFPDLVQDEG
jgi:hypothetical protein